MGCCYDKLNKFSSIQKKLSLIFFNFIKKEDRINRSSFLSFYYLITTGVKDDLGDPHDGHTKSSVSSVDETVWSQTLQIISRPPMNEPSMSLPLVTLPKSFSKYFSHEFTIL